MDWEKTKKNYDVILRKCFKETYRRVNIGRNRGQGGKKS